MQEMQKAKKDPVFQIDYIHLRVGVATTRGAHRGIQTPSLCEYRLAVEFGLYDKLHHRPFEQLSRAV